MHKCFNCGKEFEGNFCPNCGEKYAEEKKCPKCGKILPGEARFCNDCGYSFSKKSAKKRTSNPNKLFSLIKYLPFVAFALFTILLFVFYSLPVAELVLGAGFPNQSLGNVYSMKNGILSEIPKATASMYALIIFACLAVIYAVIMGVMFFTPKFRYKRIKLFGKENISLLSIINYASNVFYLITFIIGIAIIVIVKKADEGTGLITKGSCSILLIVFSIVFAVLAVVPFIVRRLSPNLVANENKEREDYLESEKLRIEEYYKTHKKPEPPKRAYKKDVYIYKHQLRRYYKAKELNVSPAIVWIDMNKIFISISAFFLLAITITLCTVIPIVTNKFRIKVVDKIELGYTYEKVEKILGKPYEGEAEDSVWKYYDKDHVSILKKLDKNAKEQESALLSGNLDKLNSLITSEERLLAKKEKDTYAYIEICFENDVVSSVYFDKKMNDAKPAEEKELKKVKIVNSEVKDYNYIYDYRNGNTEKQLIIDGLSYTAYYKDGSLYKATINIADAFELKEEDYHTYIATFTWRDKFCSYEKEAEIDSSKMDCYYKIDQDGTLTYVNPSTTTFTIPDSVTSIGDSAFDGCSKLTSVTIGNSVTSIGSGAFEDCRSLTSITIPDSVTSIGRYAFSVYIKLTKVNYLGSIDSWAMIDFGESILSSTTNLYINDVLVTKANLTTATYISDYAFYDFDNLTSVTIPDSVTSIGSYAFAYCNSLTSVTIGNSVTSIGDSAFWVCYKLVEVINKSNLNITKGSTSNGYVGYYALQVITNKADSKIIYDGDYSFYNDNGNYYLLGYHGTETEITLPNKINDSNYAIYEYAFYDCDSLTSITIPDSVTSIGKEAFAYCNSLTSVTIGNGVTSIGKYAFEDCRSLTSVTIPNSVTSIGSYAFYYCTSLESITIPDSVTYISDSAFAYCDSLTSVTIPNSVTSIGSDAFENCRNLTSVTIGDSVTSIGSDAFSGCSSLQYNVSDNAKYLGNNSNPYVWLMKIIDTSITMFNIPTTTKFIYQYAFSGCSSLESVTIGDSVTIIGYDAFSGCTDLESVTIGDSVTSIGYEAFYGCSKLTSVTIGNGVTSIGDRAFLYCYKLVEVINKSNLNITTTSYDLNALQVLTETPSVSNFIEQDDYIFYNYDGSYYLLGYKGTETEITLPNKINDSNYAIYKYAFYGCGSLTSITIPDSVTSIGNNAFRNCSSLTSITIPNSVTSIGYYAFYDCSSLESITYNGTKAQWKAISKGSYWNRNTGNYTIHCTDVDIKK